MSDSTTHLDAISASQSSKEVTANALFDAMSPNALFGRRGSTTSALTWGYYGGKYRKADGTVLSVANGTVALTDSATNYILETDGVVSKVTAAPDGWPGPLLDDASPATETGATALYAVVCSGGAVTSYTDYRTPGQPAAVNPTASSISITDAGTYFTGTDVEAALQELGAAIAAPAAADVTIVDAGTYFTGTDVEAALQEIGADLAALASSAGRHAIPIMAAAMTPSATGGCAALATIASAANQPDITTLDFDATTQEYAQFAVPMPKSWNEGTVTFKPIWSHAATTTNFGVVWDLQAVAVSNDDAIAVAYGTAQTSTDTGGTTDDLYHGPESSAITVAGTPAAEDVVFFRLSRVTGNGSDTMAIDARLHGIVLYVTTDAETDA